MPRRITPETTIDGLKKEAKRSLRGSSSLVDRFLEHACPDHHVRGGPSHVGAAAAAVRELTDHPELQQDSFYTMVVCKEAATCASGSLPIPRSQPENER